MRQPVWEQSSGFTLLEIVAVLILLSIFTALAVVQHATSDASLTAQRQVMVSHIRYAQNRSMNGDVSWGIHYRHGASSANRYYALYRGGNIADTAVLPGQSDVRVPLGDEGISIECAAGGGPLAARDFQLSFDEWGSPASTIAGAVSTSTLQLRLRKAGYDPQNIVIIQNTGFIP